MLLLQLLFLYAFSLTVHADIIISDWLGIKSQLMSYWYISFFNRICEGRKNKDGKHA